MTRIEFTVWTLRAAINAVADWAGEQIERFSIWRWHIMFMFIGLGLYLVILPMLHLIIVSVGIEVQLGNYTNVISAGVSLLTLAEAKRISQKQADQGNELNLHRHILESMRAAQARHVNTPPQTGNSRDGET